MLCRSCVFCKIQSQELVDLEHGKAGFFIYMTSNIEGCNVHNAFWHDVKTTWVNGNIRFDISVTTYNLVYNIKGRSCRKIGMVVWKSDTGGGV